MQGRNIQFREFVKRLSPELRHKFKTKIEQTTNLPMTNRFENWLKGNNMIPPSTHSSINAIAIEIQLVQIESACPGLIQKGNFKLNLFNNMTKGTTTILQARKEKGWSQTQLAEASGVAQTTISKYEREGFAPQGIAWVYQKAAAVAKALDKEISDFKEFQA